jgi:hypothetical protein
MEYDDKLNLHFSDTLCYEQEVFLFIFLVFLICLQSTREQDRKMSEQEYLNYPGI